MKPMGMAGSIAGSHLAQTKGTDIDKTQQDVSNQARQTESGSKAEKASGIGETEEDQQASDRDADGRRLWEVDAEGEEKEKEEQGGSPPAPSKDSTGQSGNQLDLSG